MKNNPIYICYSCPLMNYLKQLNILHSVTGKSISTNKQFWVYIKTDILNQALSDWSNNWSNNFYKVN